MRYISIFFIIILFASCTSTIELEQGDYEKKVVVDGWIESGNYANVYLTWSSPFLSDLDSASIRETFINYAKVTLTSSEGESEILVLKRQNNTFPPFVYKSVQIKGKAGLRYDLKVEVEGLNITASTSIPQPPEITRLIMVPMDDSTGFLKGELKPDGTKDEFLFINFKSKMSRDEIFRPCRIPVWWAKKTSELSVFNIYRNTKTYMNLINPKSDPYYGWPEFRFSLQDSVSVKVGNIDQESYDILFSVLTDQAVQENPFSFNSTGIKSNISGGIGRWTGIGVAPMLFYDGKNLKSED